LRVRQGLGEGLGVEGVDVGGGIGGKGLEGDLLDGPVGVEEDGRDGVVGAGTPIQERAGGVGDNRRGVAEDLLEEGHLFAVVGGDLAVGEGGRVEAAAGMGGEKGCEDPDRDCGGDELEAEGRGALGEIEGGEAAGDPDGGECRERSVGRGHVVGQAGLDAAEEEDLDESEDSERTEGLLRFHLRRQGKSRRRWGKRHGCVDERGPEGGVDGGGVEQDPWRRGEEEDAEVVPPGGEVAVELIGYASEDVEA